jgi:hypothetical protein
MADANGGNVLCPTTKKQYKFSEVTKIFLA